MFGHGRIVGLLYPDWHNQGSDLDEVVECVSDLSFGSVLRECGDVGEEKMIFIPGSEIAFILVAVKLFILEGLNDLGVKPQPQPSLSVVGGGSLRVATCSVSSATVFLHRS